MQHCMDSVNIRKIVTVKSFFEVVKDQIPPAFHDRFIFLEQEVAKMSLVRKFVSQFFCARRASPEEAVILFTSGSEALPKTVPLTQKNLLTDLKGTLELFPMTQQEIILSFLPPFHSFGFTVTTILPLITGIRVAYTPNPTDTAAIIRLLRHTEPTIMASTPTFLKILLQAANRDDLASLQRVVSGAEACTDDLRTQFAEKANPDAQIIEGYGITECAPVVTINPPEKPKVKSVGKFLPHLRYTIRDLSEDGAELPTGEQGMIYVRGESIFSGYLNPDLASPFEEIDGQMYYKTGDLGYVDDEGYLSITGRLKRFIKIAGEMISLPFIESILLEKYGDPEENVLAVEGLDTVDPPVIVVFATKPFDLEEMNAHLRKSGASNLVSISRIEQIDEIPVLGTGKIDYKVLKKRISSPSA